MRVLVAGGTGMLGAPVVRHLVQAGHRVRVLTRSAEKARRTLGPEIEVALGDVEDPPSLGAAVKDCQALHVSLRGADSWRSYQQVENLGLLSLLAAARTAGIRHVTYLSGAGRTKGFEHLPPIEVKLAAEKAIRRSGIDFTIFRATHFMESLDLFIDGERATILGNQPHRYRYLAARDFAVLVASALTTEGARGRVLYAFGPQAFTMAEALRRYLGALRPGMRMSQLPIPVAKLIGTVTFNRRLRFAAGLFEGFAVIGEEGNPEECDALLGKPRTTLDEWLQARAARSIAGGR